MSDRINVQDRAENLSISPTFAGYSKVIIHVDDETVIEVGNDTGLTLEFDNPFATNAMAQRILAKLNGHQYQPYDATGVILDPAAEMGDALSIKNVSGGIYKRSRTFGSLMKADVSAPRDEEIDHEYKYESPTERKFKRQVDDVKASILIQAGLIEAKVSKTSPAGNTSFSWAMNDTSHTWYANGSQVMKVDKSGLDIKGKITATSGYIGNGTSGFTISAKAFYNGVTSLSDTAHTGVYVGTDGIVCGKGAFKVTNSGAVTASNLIINGGSIKIGSNFSVDSSGNVSANNMKLTGTLNIGGTNITAAALRSGAQSAYSNASYWSGGSGYGYSYSNAINANSGSYPSFFRASLLRGDILFLGNRQLFINSEGFVKAL